MTAELESALRALPAVHEIAAHPVVREAAGGLAPQITARLAREAIDAARAKLRFAPANGGAAPGGALGETIAKDCARRIAALRAPQISSAINATGIIVHTGLGRSPLSEAAAQALARAARGYCDVAISREDGLRRPRAAAIEPLLRALTGCEAALAVNNNAAALVLALAAHARGREVVVSRGQLVEIGGSFRLPEVMESAGARLREVGTTNRTRLADYERAIGPETAALLRIHPSNFRVVGFAESAEIGELARLAHARGVLAIDDIGSGALIDLAPYGMKGEPVAGASIAAGADIVLFSGDKLLGGPQAGIIIGTRAAVSPLAKHPLMRALRPDKLALAALEATLRLYLEPERLAERLPVLRAIAEPEAEVRRRALRLAARLRKAAPGIKTRVVKDAAYVGGGSLPEEALPSWVVIVAPPSCGVESAKKQLRQREVAVFARARQDRLEFDMRTVADREAAELAAAISALFATDRAN